MGQRGLGPEFADIEAQVEEDEEGEQALDDQGVVGEAHRRVQHAGDRRPEEVARRERRGEEARDHGLGVRSCGAASCDSCQLRAAEAGHEDGCAADPLQHEAHRDRGQGGRAEQRGEVRGWQQQYVR